jgi:RNA polymerase sigma-70 factor (ECF subfamily)
MDEAAFDDWVAPHIGVLRALAIREIGSADADDVLQETLIRAWRRRRTYRPERGSARAWLVAVLLDQLRRRRLRSHVAVHHVLGSDAGGEGTETAVGLRVDVEKAVKALPRRQREVITLFYLPDLSVEDVARVLNLKTGSVKSCLSDAREALRVSLEPQ